MTFFAATVEEHPVDGVLDEHTDAAGHIAEFTLMLRPLAQLQAAVARMARALSALGQTRRIATRALRVPPAVCGSGA